MKMTSLIPLLLISSAAFGLETDNYLSWNHILPDSRSEVNDFMEKKIEEALAMANGEERISTCEEITLKIARQFKTTPRSKSLEEFVGEKISKENIYPTHGNYLEMSILSNTRFYLKYSGLSPNLQINGYYFGADKLSHFASTGRRYYKRYLRMKENGSTEEEALKAAIRYGLLNESSVLGRWASGVFSYGDMEANYQGLRYYLRMCTSGDSQYLSQDEAGKWSLIRKPDLADYVSGHWDETYNQSYFSKNSWEKVRIQIENKYCHMRTDPIVQERIKYYRDQNHASFSLEYIKELQNSGKGVAPIPSKDQSIDDLCQKKSSQMTQQGP
jgi:hypothetical protein